MNENNNLRSTQLVQDFHPVLRRRAFTSIRSSFPSYFTTQHHEVQGIVPSMDESQKVIYENFGKINHIIDVVDEHIRKRIQCYEKEVVKVVQKEIQQMRQQTEKVVVQFNNMILEKNKQTQIWSLNNELDYFRSEAKKLFEANRQLKIQNKEMAKRVKDYEWELQNREVIMQKLLYKYQKEKLSKSKLKRKLQTALRGIHQSESNINNSNLIKSNNLKNIISNNKINDNKNSLRLGISEETLEPFLLNRKQSENSFSPSNQTISQVKSKDKQIEQNSLLQIKLEQSQQQVEEELNLKQRQEINKNYSQASSQLSSQIQFVSNHIKNIELDTENIHKAQFKNDNVHKFQSKNTLENIHNNTKSTTKNNQKLVDQSTQVNIYLSEHSYKSLFDKKHNPIKNHTLNQRKNKKVQTLQISTQTLSMNHDQNGHNQKNLNYLIKQEINLSPKSKSINYTKNGFTIKQPSTHKNHLRTNSFHLHSKINMETHTAGFPNHSKIKIHKLYTQTNFNKTTEEFEFQLITPKPQHTEQKNHKNKNKSFNKMANKFQRNKIAERAYQKNSQSDKLFKKDK